MTEDDNEIELPPENIKLIDPDAEKLVRNLQKREKQQSASFWRAVFNSAEGRREMWRILNDDCHGFSPPFACGPNGAPQSEATWYQAGMYALGQRLYQRWLLVARDGVAKMHDENDPNFIKKKGYRRARN